MGHVSSWAQLWAFPLCVGLCYAAQVGRLFHGLIVRRPAFVRELFDKISFWIEWFKLMLDHPCSLRFPREYGHTG
jgi:hypothetical protein